MYFKVFNISASMDEDLKKFGFCVHSTQEVKSYRSGGSSEIHLIPDEYEYDSALWVESRILPCYERLFCLMKEPEPSFEELWKIFLSSKNEDDEIGSISLILGKYDKELLDIIRRIGTFTRAEKGKIKKLMNYTRCSDSGSKEEITRALKQLLE